VGGGHAGAHIIDTPVQPSHIYASTPPKWEKRRRTLAPPSPNAYTNTNRRAPRDKTHASLLEGSCSLSLSPSLAPHTGTRTARAATQRTASLQTSIRRSRRLVSKKVAQLNPY
jgi:hypothetical protein